MIGFMRRGNRRKAPEGRRFALPDVDWRRIGRAAAAVATLGAFGALLSQAIDQPLRRVLLEGSFQRVSPVEVEQVVRRNVDGGFLSADLGALRRGIESLAWVDRARVQRRWPDAIAVEVVEQIPVARWGEDGLLNTRGELFVSGARHLPPELPRLDGPPGSEAAVARRYLAVQERLVEQGLRLAALRLDPRGAWEMTLTNGVTVRLGRRDVDARMERFVLIAAEVIAGRAAEIAHVDMRYSNGFSIGWRDGAEPRAPRAAAAQRTQEPETDA